MSSFRTFGSFTKAGLTIKFFLVPVICRHDADRGGQTIINGSHKIIVLILCF